MGRLAEVPAPSRPYVAIACAVVWLLARPCAADVTARLHVASDVVVRGVSHTDGAPVAGGRMELDFAGGWFVGGAGYAANESPVPNLTRGYQGYVGWFRQLSEARALELSLAANRFSGDFRYDWDYLELRADWHLRRSLAVTLALSDDYYGRDSRSALASFTWTPELGARAYARLEAGGLRLSGDEDSWLGYAQAALGLRLGRFDVSSGLSRVDGSTARIFPSSGRHSYWLRLDCLLR